MKHGTASGYATYGCRCAPCTRAQRERMREYRKRQTDAVPSTPTRSMRAADTKAPSHRLPPAEGMASKDRTP
jgi:hypothetical protein